ncbi:Arm DNA-binding domain-containing protein [Sphingorhabdus sp.]|jgi:hypothetical protein|uniref:Arm DNA-binding domain-containing protein n=1 Tax=Sphingorhabdus sp. TaxID=1902408 RepID=UPI0037C742AF
MTKITKRAVEAAAPREKEYYIWDEDIPGLGLRVLPSGRRQYIVQYRAGRRSRRISLGPSTILTTEQARSRALAILADARGGKDPAADREAYRNALLLKDLVERFDQQHIALRLKPRTAAAKISPISASLSSAVMVLGSGRPGAHLTLGGAAG